MDFSVCCPSGQQPVFSWNFFGIVQVYLSAAARVLSGVFSVDL